MSILKLERLLKKDDTNRNVQKLFDDLQGNILKSHARPFAKLIFLNLSTNEETNRKWITGLLRKGKITSMRDQLTQIESFNNNEEGFKQNDPGFFTFSLSKSGYDKLGILELPKGSVNNSTAFEDGMNGRILNDSKPKTWDEPYKNSIDVLLTVANNNLQKLEQHKNSILNSLPNGIADLIVEDGLQQKRKINGEDKDVEHFGFADGVSQPRYFEGDLQKEKGTTTWDPSAKLSLVLVKDPNGKAFTGNEDEVSTDNNGSHGFGSFLVFRKLEQDVKGWNEAVKNVTSIINNNGGIANEPLIGAYAVGRFQNGTPVVLDKTDTGNLTNNFDYNGNLNGSKCPFHAHIRKTNPRGEIKGELDRDKNVRRITRRGITYGKRNKGMTDKPNKGVGLLFMCYQSSIEAQFEFMQNSWADNPKFRPTTKPTPLPNVDSVIGQTNNKDELKKQWPKEHEKTDLVEHTFETTVTLKGGAYFFTPSISFLKSLAPNPEV